MGTSFCDEKYVWSDYCVFGGYIDLMFGAVFIAVSNEEEEIAQDWRDGSTSKYCHWLVLMLLMQKH